MKSAVRSTLCCIFGALLALTIPQVATAEEVAPELDDELPMAGDADAGPAIEFGQDLDLELQPAAQRPPLFVEIDAGLGPRMGLASAWNTGNVLGTDVRAGFGMWRGERMALFANVGIANAASHSVDRYRAPAAVTERVRMMPVRAGAKFNLRPRPSWLELNVIGGLSMAMGSRDLIFGNSVSRMVATEDFFSIGAGGGVELAMVKFKTLGITFKGEYYFQPASLDDDQGFMSGGTTDLGGVLVSVGMVYFLGGPR